MLRDVDKVVRGAAAVLLSAGLVAGCASADKKPAGTHRADAMPGMNMAAGMTVGAVKAIPSRVLATADWQGMKIVARTMTAAPFLLPDGSGYRMVRPGPKTSFHLMVTLSDAHTGVPIPYASVWATFTRGGQVVYDERQWPMLSAFMGPHYGNNVQLPGAGRYTLTLLVSPPVAARHLEYRGLWASPHRVSAAFDWKPVR